MLVVWKGIMWVCFCSSCASGVFGGILLGQVNGYKIGASYGFFVVNFEWTLDGRFGRILGLENLDEPRLVDLEGLLVGNFKWTLAG